MIGDFSSEKYMTKIAQMLGGTKWKHSIARCLYYMSVTEYLKVASNKSSVYTDGSHVAWFQYAQISVTTV